MLLNTLKNHLQYNTKKIYIGEIVMDKIEKFEDYLLYWFFILKSEPHNNNTMLTYCC